MDGEDGTGVKTGRVCVCVWECDQTGTFLEGGDRFLPDMISSLAASLLAFSASPHRSFQRIQSSTVIDPRDGSAVSPLPAATTQGKKTLCFLTPKLGEFDSSELAELLVEVQDDLEDAGIELDDWHW